MLPQVGRGLPGIPCELHRSNSITLSTRLSNSKNVPFFNNAR
jgi:hypothetical protein